MRARRFVCHLEVSLIKSKVSAFLESSGSVVVVLDDGRRGCVSEVDSIVCMIVKFGSAFARLPRSDFGTEDSDVGEVGSSIEEIGVWNLIRRTVPKSVFNIDGMFESAAPESWW